MSRSVASAATSTPRPDRNPASSSRGPARASSERLDVHAEHRQPVGRRGGADQVGLPQREGGHGPDPLGVECLDRGLRSPPRQHHAPRDADVAPPEREDERAGRLEPHQGGPGPAVGAPAGEDGLQGGERGGGEGRDLRLLLPAWAELRRRPGRGLPRREDQLGEAGERRVGVVPVSGGDVETMASAADHADADGGQRAGYQVGAAPGRPDHGDDTGARPVHLGDGGRHRTPRPRGTRPRTAARAGDRVAFNTSSPRPRRPARTHGRWSARMGHGGLRRRHRRRGGRARRPRRRGTGSAWRARPP